MRKSDYGYNVDHCQYYRKGFRRQKCHLRVSTGISHVHFAIPEATLETCHVLVLQARMLSSQPKSRDFLANERVIPFKS
jgi:hypothetical protein